MSKGEGDEDNCVARKGGRTDLHVLLGWLFLGISGWFSGSRQSAVYLDGVENIGLVHLPVTGVDIMGLGIGASDMNAFNYATLEGILTRTKKALIRTEEAYPHHCGLRSSKTEGG